MFCISKLLLWCCFITRFKRELCSIRQDSKVVLSHCYWTYSLLDLSDCPSTVDPSSSSCLPIDQYCDELAEGEKRRREVMMSNRFNVEMDLLVSFTHFSIVCCSLCNAESSSSDSKHGYDQSHRDECFPGYWHLEFGDFRCEWLWATSESALELAVQMRPSVSFPLCSSSTSFPFT